MPIKDLRLLADVDRNFAPFIRERLKSPSLGAFSILRAQVKRLVVLTNSLNDSTPKRGAPLGEQPPRTNLLLRRRRFISEARRENATLSTLPVCGTDLFGNPIYAKPTKSEKKAARTTRPTVEQTEIARFWKKPTVSNERPTSWVPRGLNETGTASGLRRRARFWGLGKRKVFAGASGRRLPCVE